MEELAAAVSARPPLTQLLSEAASVQACGRCCLRLAGVSDAAAYSSTSLPYTAAGVVRALQELGGEAAAPRSEAASRAVATTTNDDEATTTSKRRRLEPADPFQGQPDASTPGPVAQSQPQPAAAAAAADEPAAVCPLCVGLLQSAALPGSSKGGGHSGVGVSSSSSSQLRASLEIITTVSTLNDPARHTATAWGAQASTAAAAVADGVADGEAAAGTAASSGSYAPVVEKRATAVPSLAAAAEAVRTEHEFESFALEVSLPASLAVRQQALTWRLRQAGRQAQGAAEALTHSIDVKEAVRLCFTAALEAALGKPHDPEADLHICLSASHPDALAECGWLAASSGGGGRQRWGRGRHGRQAQQQQQQQQQEVPALSAAVVQRLAALTQAEFAASCPPAAAQPAPPGSAAVVALQARRRPLHVGGRYLKLRRGIPQSPWFIDGQRKGEGSVQEAIEQVVLPAFKADAYTMVSAGREDIDVRMLGEGRPFILEIQNARRAVPPPAELHRLEAAVLQTSACGVAVRGLFAASASQLAQMKEGEQEKQKSYRAVCWLPRPLTDADVALLEATRDLEVQQETPVRVLHRRANLCRPRVVHELHATRLPGQPPGYFTLDLRTQAGTYIKEFVHGDLGRSRPSLGDLLGGCQAQIVTLDVAEIHMQFGA